MARTRKKGYTKCGDYMEVRIRKDAHYPSVVAAARDVLGIESEEEDEEGEWGLLRIDGTVVPNRPIEKHPWTAARYLNALGKTASQVKFGVGYITDVSFVTVNILYEAKAPLYLPVPVCQIAAILR